MCALEQNLQKKMSSIRLRLMTNLLPMLFNEIVAVIYALRLSNEMELETHKDHFQVKQLSLTLKLKRSTTQQAEAHELTSLQQSKPEHFQIHQTRIIWIIKNFCRFLHKDEKNNLRFKESKHKNSRSRSKKF